MRDVSFATAQRQITIVASGLPCFSPLLQTAGPGFGVTGTMSSEPSSPAVTFGEDQRALGGNLARTASEAAAAAAARARAEAEVELERSRVNYDRWRIAEEAKFAKLLREKVRADAAHAQQEGFKRFASGDSLEKTRTCHTASTGIVKYELTSRGSFALSPSRNR